jgi:hypothetical protein
MAQTHEGRGDRDGAACGWMIAAGWLLAAASAAAEPPHNGAVPGHASPPAQQAPRDQGSPSPTTALDNDAQRIATALEGKNSFDQSNKGQQDAHEAAKGAEDAAGWAGVMVVVAGAETLITGAGVLLVGLTLRQVKITAEQTQKQADATAQMLELTRRPRIHVRLVVADLSGPGIEVTVGYANRGEETAYIHRLDCDLFYRDAQTKRWSQWPVWRDIEGDATTPTPVANGMFREQPFTFAKPIDTVWHEVERGHRTELCLVGHVRYEDRRRVTRRTGFIWAWEPMQRNFVPLDDPRWSFED